MNDIKLKCNIKEVSFETYSSTLINSGSSFKKYQLFKINKTIIEGLSLERNKKLEDKIRKEKEDYLKRNQNKDESDFYLGFGLFSDDYFEYFGMLDKIEVKCKYFENCLIKKILFYDMSSVDYKIKYNFVTGEIKTDGLLMKECNYNKINKLDGVYKEYNNNKLNIKCYYTNGLKNGKYFKYYENFSIEKEENYKNNKLNGLYIYYYCSGNISIKCIYSDGILNGEYKEYYDEKDKIKLKCFYNNGNLNGKFERRDLNGKKMKIKKNDFESNVCRKFYF
jgi:antitoxin component YwqK of YwqJK toxin-antitoxin module